MSISRSEVESDLSQFSLRLDVDGDSIHADCASLDTNWKSVGLDCGFPLSLFDLLQPSFAELTSVCYSAAPFLPLLLSSLSWHLYSKMCRHRPLLSSILEIC